MAVDADKATASFEHGILTLTLPKAEAAKPKRIRSSAPVAG
jgi:HSP20 family molecular chaperone IbpA